MFKTAALALSIAALSAPLVAQDLPRVSPKSSLTQTIGLTDVTITYNRPSVRGRTIWGELVPFEQVWRTGANEATVFTVSDDVTINGEKLAKGSYSLHTIPGRDEWTLIFNKGANQWGSYAYDQAQDALRVKVKPRSGGMVETMSFSIPNVGRDSAEVILAWDRLEVPFTVGTNTMDKAFANIEKVVNEDWRALYRSADFAFQNDARPDDAMKWIDRSIAIQANHTNLRLKAQMLAKRGDVKNAIATGERAIAAGLAAQPKVDVTGTQKLVAEWKAKR
jgi:hypothetical protein